MQQSIEAAHSGSYTEMVWGHVSYESAMVWCMIQKAMYVQYKFARWLVRVKSASPFL